MVVITPAIYEQLEKIPTIRPPPGVTPNFINPPIDHYSAWIVAATLALTLSTIFVLIRVYTRFFIIKIHGWEDCKWLTFSLTPFPPHFREGDRGGEGNKKEKKGTSC